MSAKSIIRAGLVSRWHTRTPIVPQNNAEHSFNCALIAIEICDLFNDIVISEFTYVNMTLDASRCSAYMLVHDLGEVGACDFPGHLKTDEIKKIVEDAEAKFVRNNMTSTVIGMYNKNNLNILEQLVCHYSDKVESLIKSYREMRMGNNLQFAECVSNIENEISRIYRAIMRTDVPINFEKCPDVWKYYLEILVEVLNGYTDDIKGTFLK